MALTHEYRLELTVPVGSDIDAHTGLHAQVQPHLAELRLLAEKAGGTCETRVVRRQPRKNGSAPTLAE